MSRFSLTLIIMTESVETETMRDFEKVKENKFIWGEKREKKARE